MIDIDWSKQPTPEHAWAEDLNDIKDSDFEGWCIPSPSGGWLMRHGSECEIGWNCDAEKDGNVRIHRKPESSMVKEVGSGDYANSAVAGYYQKLGKAIYEQNEMPDQKFTPKEPGYMPKVGDIVDLISKRDNLDSVWEAKLLCVGNQFVFVRGYDGESMYSLGYFDIKPHNSDRDIFIDRAVDVMNASIDDTQEGWARAMYAHGARFTDE